MWARLLLLTLVGGVALPATAQEPEDPRLAQASARFEEAQAAYGRSDYASALEAFTEVLQTMEQLGHPNAVLVLYNIARTNQRLGQDADALEQYDRFLREAADDAPNREEAARNAAELRRRQQIRGDPEPPSESDPHTPGPAPAPTGGGISAVGLVVAGIGAASLIAGAALGGVALSESGAASAECTDGVCPPGARDGIANAQTLANASDGLLFGGLGVAAVGAILMFALADDGAEDGDLEASAACGPTQCFAVVGGSF